MKVENCNKNISVCWRIFRRLCLLLIIGISLTTCKNLAQVVRKATYPSDFNYVSGEQLRSRMQQLGYELRQLDMILAAEHDQPPELQQQVIDGLGEIERIAGGLQAGEAGASHGFLQDDMVDFMIDVRQARMGASLNPPRYYMAGRVSGACVNCHKINR